MTKRGGGEEGEGRGGGGGGGGGGLKIEGTLYCTCNTRLKVCLQFWLSIVLSCVKQFRSNKWCGRGDTIRTLSGATGKFWACSQI